VKTSDPRVAFFMSPTSAATSSSCPRHPYGPGPSAVPHPPRAQHARRDRQRQPKYKQRWRFHKVQFAEPEERVGQSASEWLCHSIGDPDLPYCRPDLSPDPQIACGNRDVTTTTATTGREPAGNIAGFLARWPRVFSCLQASRVSGTAGRVRPTIGILANPARHPAAAPAAIAVFANHPGYARRFRFGGITSRVPCSALAPARKSGAR
jgi:hypothetical protein